ncbi:SAC3/GANP/Nin1/mts3/eIF-3 p25 [Penicillium macrosclerotiorum]|uniref:SAC3/GANP/Nin1/mts3/eIF-3 p25 n=1 Tax=Penicillium macrosclerotiorum TaxID=303699 RepID=UPI0025466E81|nr:SAC3/GANP/Nin1/mts3/eIF-3 p25 [Penicillium macrosclerotiorum]KAJ5683290.1 SAC3/GANP/Nin1/mts3/eIF-3 p25 [Penicillium macrosclerotiorum]
MHSRSPGSRLKPVADSLENVGFVSKGDKKLLNHQAQQEYFDKIVTRYFKFCDDHKKDLDAAFASLPTSASNDVTSNPPTARPTLKPRSAAKDVPPPSAELSTLLLSLRKLREAVRATATTTPIEFAQKVHYLSIRIAIRAHHPPSYFPSLQHSLDELHSKSHPLPESEVKELVSWLILDYACRLGDMASAFELRSRARREYTFHSRTVDQVLSALMHDNWVLFWQVRQNADMHERAVMDWAVDRVRRHALKAVGSAYLNVHVNWIVGGCTGDVEGWTWEKLVETENLGWEKEGDKVIIRRPKPRPAPVSTPTQPSSTGP